MSLSVGIVGLPNVGKSTLFNALLKKQQALVANYPFATIDPNVGIVPVPDKRLERLAETVAAGREHKLLAPVSLPLVQILGEAESPKVGMLRGKESEPIPVSPDTGNEVPDQVKLPPLKPATVKFVDIAGIVKGASVGEGLGNKFLAHIRETNLICLVVRAFTDNEVVLSGTGEIKGDVETVMTELILADMETVGKQAEPKGNVTPEQKKRYQAILKIKLVIDQGKRADTAELDDEDKTLVNDLGLLTMKPVMYLANTSEQQLGKTFPELPPDQVVICAKTEAELVALSETEQKEYLHSLGLAESGLERLIKAAYTKLGLISFLTAGEIECRAWTIKQGMTAVEASGVIHTDFMKKFIKADVIPWQEFVKQGGWKRAREAGVVKSEGRDYIMKDGEVVEFKIGG